MHTPASEESNENFYFHFIRTPTVKRMHTPAFPVLYVRRVDFATKCCVLLDAVVVYGRGVEQFGSSQGS